VPEGAHVLGRVRHVDRSGKAGQRVLTLEFSEIETGGARARFFAELQNVRLPRGRVEVMHDPHLSGVGIVTLAFDQTEKIVANDLRMSWTTARVN